MPILTKTTKSKSGIKWIQRDITGLNRRTDRHIDRSDGRTDEHDEHQSFYRSPQLRWVQQINGETSTQTGMALLDIHILDR